MQIQLLEPVFTHVMQWITLILETMGVAAIFFGIVLATVEFFRRRIPDEEKRFDHYRRKMGRSILLGLEFLVAADIVNTVALHLTLTNLGLLAALVLIRTFLSFTIELEVSGRWPWQAKKGEA